MKVKCEWARGAQYMSSCAASTPVVLTRLADSVCPRLHLRELEPARAELDEDDVRGGSEGHGTAKGHGTASPQIGRWLSNDFLSLLIAIPPRHGEEMEGRSSY